MGTAFKLEISAGEINRIGLAYAVKEVTDTTRRVFNRANVLTLVDTGRLRAGNQMRVGTKGKTAVGEIFNEVTYAEAVHGGSRAHTVRPRRKKVLRFKVGGATVFSAYANIPARRGRPWLTRALKEIAAPKGYTIT